MNIIPINPVILHLEDSDLDAEFIRHRLDKEGFVGQLIRARERDEFLSFLASDAAMHLILSDYELPTIHGSEVLDLVRQHRPDLPLIFVSGALGEEVAVAMLKDGATDYILKHRLERLTSAIERALAEASEKTERRRVERELMASQEQIARLLEAERAARAEAERAGHVKDEFLATLSHELRTPLNAILGYARLIRSSKISPEKRDEAAETIERNARLQAQLIEDLLDMNRIISGKLRLDVQQIDLPEIIEAALETVRPSADSRGIRIQKMIDPYAGPVRGDSARLQQVVWNLLSNAIKFTPKEGKIQVSLERVSSHLEVSVADTGMGIEPAFLPHVFDRFRQADASTTRKHGGLGLGLSIVKHLVELHGGTVRAKSPGAGQGATFTVVLPVAVIHEEAVVPRRVHPKVPNKTHGDCEVDLLGVRVLAIDDEPDSCRLVKEILEECHATVRTAQSADEAMKIFQQEIFDIIVSDIGMPDEDGYSLIKRLRAWEKKEGRRTPALALTAFARSDDRRQAALAGFQSHLAKPVEAAELVATVASLIGRTGESDS
ncbi:MAG: response regulator [Bdellovibrionota bacterium]